MDIAEPGRGVGLGLGGASESRSEKLRSSTVTSCVKPPAALPLAPAPGPARHPAHPLPVPRGEGGQARRDGNLHATGRPWQPKGVGEQRPLL